MKTILQLAAAGLAATLLAGTARADDWRQFRGPNGSGVAAADARPPAPWSATQNMQWRTALPGPGSSSPIVVGDRVFVTCYSGYGDGGNGGPDQLVRHLVAVDRATGKILWDQSVAARLPEDNFSGYLTEHGYASSTPVSDGERVYVFFGKTGACAFDLAGKQLWAAPLGQMSSNRRWGSGASPVLWGDKLIVNAADESRAVFALDKATGKQLWKSEAATLELCFGTPIVTDGPGGRQDLVLAVPGELWGLNPENGKLRWFAETRLDGNVSPTVVTDGGVVFSTGGFPRTGTVAVRAGGKGDVTGSNVVWSSQSASYVPSPVATGGRLYVVSDQGFAACLDARTGEALYKERLPGATGGGGGGGKPFYASPVLAHGRLYAVSRRQGVFVLGAGAKFEFIAQNRITGDDTDFNGTPAVVGPQLFLRSNRALYCLTAEAAAGAGKAQ